jgi:hypothetical protein
MLKVADHLLQPVDGGEIKSIARTKTRCSVSATSLPSIVSFDKESEESQIECDSTMEWNTSAEQ